MPGYLETYGAGEAKRERNFKRVATAALVVLVVAGAAYLFLRNYREKQQANLFFELLAKKDYKAAYALWGCTPSTPCPNYDESKFMEDWGPNGSHADLSALKITRFRGCTSGVIVEANFGGGVIEYLWVDRTTRYLGYAPFSVCNPVYRPNEGKSGGSA